MRHLNQGPLREAKVICRSTSHSHFLGPVVILVPNTNQRLFNQEVNWDCIYEKCFINATYLRGAAVTVCQDNIPLQKVCANVNKEGK